MTFYTNLRKRKFTEDSSDPTVNDDASEGFGKFDLWINTVSCEVFILVDPTDGAAKWESLSGATPATSLGETTFSSSTITGTNIDWTGVLDTFTATWGTGTTLTVPAGEGGDYQVIATVAVEGGADFQAFVDFNINGTPSALGQAQATAGTLGAPYFATVTIVWTGTLAAGDALTFPTAGAGYSISSLGAADGAQLAIRRIA